MLSSSGHQLFGVMSNETKLQARVTVSFIRYAAVLSFFQRIACPLSKTFVGKQPWGSIKTAFSCAIKDELCLQELGGEAEASGDWGKHRGPWPDPGGPWAHPIHQPPRQGDGGPSTPVRYEILAFQMRGNVQLRRGLETRT
jgi:hypothetical protein